MNSTNQIKINTKLCEIVDLNNFFYAINNLNKIYILNKKNLEINKTINIDLNKYDNSNFFFLHIILHF